MKLENLMHRLAAILMIGWVICPAVDAWDAHGHRTITYLALDALPPDAPAWLREAKTRHRVAYQANQADRWRGWRSAALNHQNRPDHYLNEEYLDQFSLTLQTVPPLRREFLRAMAVAKHVHPERVVPYDSRRDPDRVREWPGFLLHAMAEHYAKLQAAFNEVRILEQLAEPARAFQLEQARANAIYHLGLLSHFVADAAQPLHTTKHYNGWVGENPKGYPTKRGIHSLIDGDLFRYHVLTYESLRPHMKHELTVNAADPWGDLRAYFRRSFGKVEPLYALQRAGELTKPAGKALIIERINDGAAMLGALYWAAYTSAAPTAEQVRSFVRFNGFEPETLPKFTPRAAESDSNGQ